MNLRLFDCLGNHRWTTGPYRLLLLLSILSASSGCSAVTGIREYMAYNDHQNEFVLGWRNRAWAANAWHMRRAQFEGQPYIEHFGAGFRAGYADVAAGANGCTPALPPRKYWSWKYQTPEGQGKTAAWFAGYPHGAKAAEEDGAGNYSQIQVSSTARAEYDLGHEPPYNAPLFLHDPAEWCRQHGETIEPGMQYEPVPLENGAPPATDPSQPYEQQGPTPLQLSPQASRTNFSRLPSPHQQVSFQAAPDLNYQSPGGPPR